MKNPVFCNKFRILIVNMLRTNTSYQTELREFVSSYVAAALKAFTAVSDFISDDVTI